MKTEAQRALDRALSEDNRLEINQLEQEIKEKFKDSIKIKVLENDYDKAIINGNDTYFEINNKYYIIRGKEIITSALWINRHNPIMVDEIKRESLLRVIKYLYEQGISKYKIAKILSRDYNTIKYNLNKMKLS